MRKQRDIERCDGHPLHPFVIIKALNLNFLMFLLQKKEREQYFCLEWLYLPEANTEYHGVQHLFYTNRMDPSYQTQTGEFFKGFQGNNSTIISGFFRNWIWILVVSFAGAVKPKIKPIHQLSISSKMLLESFENLFLSHLLNSTKRKSRKNLNKMLDYGLQKTKRIRVSDT